MKKLKFDPLVDPEKSCQVSKGLYIQTELLPVEEQEKFYAEMNARVLELAAKYGIQVWDSKVYLYPKPNWDPAYWKNADVYIAFQCSAAILLKPFVLKGTDQGSTELDGPQGEEGCGHACGCC